MDGMRHEPGWRGKPSATHDRMRHEAQFILNTAMNRKPDELSQDGRNVVALDRRIIMRRTTAFFTHCNRAIADVGRTARLELP